MYAIFDVDGTISSAEHRRPAAAQGYWQAFHLAGDRDAPVREVVDMVREFKKDGDVVILTMRPERYRSNLEEWLMRHGVPYTELLMKPDHDWRPGTEVKRSIYREYLVPKYGIPNYAVDDWDEVLDMWREEGVRVIPVVDPDLTPYG